jgi:soluble lytic murein transglycosylase-like protein
MFAASFEAADCTNPRTTTPQRIADVKLTMTKFPRARLSLLFLSAFALSSATAVAQSTIYSFDNFDTRNGVRVISEPVKTPVSTPRSRRASRNELLRKASDNSQATVSLDDPASKVKNTALLYEPVGASTLGTASPLRGYTTGSAQIDNYLIDSGTKNGIDPLLLYSIMHQESSFKSYAISPKGARGLMQLMPGTAMRFGVTNIFDPRQNIEGGARYVRFLLDLFDGNVNLTLAGYNAGEGAVQKYGWQVPPYSETQEYVRRISRRYSLLRDPNAALYAARLSTTQLAKLQGKPAAPLTVYERSVLTVRLPDGRLQLMSQ